MKKLYIIMALVMTGIMAEAQTSVWNGTRKLWTRGEGTESSPYLIESAENLAFFSYFVNIGFETQDLYFTLTTDIDLNGSEDQPWVPIGQGNTYFYEDGCERVPDPYYAPNNSFRGHFDGGGHKIYNIYTMNVSIAGLFGATDAFSVIENVHVESGYVQNALYGGGIVGKGNTTTVISNCSNGADISGDYVGGIIGYSGGNVNRCCNSGYIKGNIAGGGISGTLTSGISECYNTGRVVAYSNANGGIIGTSVREVTIVNCYNMGRVYGTAQHAGGIGGSLLKGLVKNCYNAGDLSGSQGTVGGIIGSSFNGTVDNIYYLNTCGGDGLGEALTDIEMRDEAFVTVLNKDTDVWGYDENYLNEGYPILESSILSTTETPEMRMSVYPNPVKDVLTLRFYDGNEPVSITLYDLAGRLVEIKCNRMESIDMSAMPAGVYMLRVTMKDATCYHEKILKD